MILPELDGELVSLRPVLPGDLPTLHRIIEHPEVAAWWAAPDSYDEMLAITLDGMVIGAIEYSEENEPDYRHAGIDIFLDPAHRGRGLGTDAVRTLAHWLVVERGHHRLTIDPAAENEAAIRSYTKVGFRPVGIMRNYERAPISREWRDGLLMDVLAEELT